MIAANITLGEEIWFLFELILIVLRTRTDKTARKKKRRYCVGSFEYDQ